MTNQAKKRQYGKLARAGMFWAVARQATDPLISLPTTIILARLLSPAEFGIAAIAYFFLSLGTRLTQFGLNASLLRLKDLRPEHTSSVFLLNLALGGTAWGVLAMLAPAIAEFVRSEQARAVIPVAGLTLLISAFGTVPGTLLAREMQYREAATCEWIGSITNSIVAILLAWNGFGFWSIVYASLASDITRTVAKLLFARWWPSFHFSLSALRELISFGAGIYVKNLLEYTVQNIDNLIVGRLLGVTALGFYDKAFSVASRMVARINLAGPTVSLRIFALIHEEPERFRRAYRRVVLAVTIVGYPIFTALIVVADDLIPLLFGSRWQPSVLPFQILCGAGMLKLLNTYASSATQAKGMIWSEVSRHVLSTVLLVVSVAVFCRWGIAGAAAGVLLATTVMTILMQELVRRLTGLQWSDLIGPQVPALICSIGLALVLGVTRFGVERYIGDVAAWTSLLLAGAAGTLYYMAFLLFFGSGEMREVIDETLNDVAPVVARRLKAATSGTDLPAVGG